MSATASIGQGIPEIFEKIVFDIDALDANGIFEKRRLSR